MSSLNRYIILNMLAAFVLSIVVLFFSLVTGTAKASEPIYDAFYARYPEYADIDDGSLYDSDSEFTKAWNNFQADLPPAWERKASATLIAYLIVGGFGGTLLIIWAFVFKIRRRIVRR